MAGRLNSAPALSAQVETEDRFEWIGGSSIGGGTFWGLGALLTKTQVLGPAGRPAAGFPSSGWAWLGGYKRLLPRSRPTVLGP